MVHCKKCYEEKMSAQTEEIVEVVQIDDPVYEEV